MQHSLQHTLPPTQEEEFVTPFFFTRQTEKKKRKTKERERERERERELTT